MNETLRSLIYFIESKEQKYQNSLPRGLNKQYTIVFKTIAQIAKKFNLDQNQLADAFVEAWRDGTFKFGKLTIRYRGINGSCATFLITAGNEVVSQFPINIGILKYWISQKEVAEISL
jgi:hypothetical protein